MKIPVRSHANITMIETCLLNSNSNHSLIAVAYKNEQEKDGKKVYPIATTATVEQVMCWSANNSRLHYTLHLLGVSRVRIEQFATPMCLVKQLYSIHANISSTLEKEFIENVKRLIMTTYNEANPSLRQLKNLLSNVTVHKFDEITDLCMSLLQSVSYEHQLAYLAELDVANRTHTVNEILQEYFKVIYTIRPELFLKVFASEVCADLADKRQHDAQEFQIYLLNALHEDMNKVTKPESFEQNYDGHDLAKNAEDYKARQNRFSSSPVNDVFNLRTVSQLSCSVCRSTSVTFEEMNQISVELPQETSSSRLSECL
uniref:USP domain-containing protein n=1 Tax=Acrobeloides nanus TaxID=290746 RepID=A0A914EEG4_9BILA